MDRSKRFHQKAVARVRKTRIIRYRNAYWYWPHPRPWRPLTDFMMNEPGWWVREFMMRPARVRARQLCRLVVLGRDDAEWRWPDGKKPHQYYW